MCILYICTLHSAYIRAYVYTLCCQFCWVNGSILYKLYVCSAYIRIYTVLPVLLGEWVNGCILYKLYVCSAYIRIYTVLPAMLGGSFSVIQQYIGCLNGCMQCLLHLCLLYVLSAHLLCGLCMHYITSAVYYSVTCPSPHPHALRH